MRPSARYGYFLLLLLFFTHSVNAQLCTGSLGDPIVNITFGSGTNPGPPLTAAAIGYSYSSADCPNDGSYTIRSSTTACFANSWHSVSADHTGNPGGYFMLVNASNSPGDFYVDTVRGLCSGTTYQFSAWLLNVLLATSCGSNGNRPNITFSIEEPNGTVIQQHNSGDIPATATPQWKEHGFFFVTPANIDKVVLRLRNNAPGGCGNDLILDDITFRPCGPVLTSSITGAGQAKEICEGDTATLFFQSSISGGFNAPHFQWQHMNNSASQWIDIPGANGSSFSVFMNGAAIPGDYYYRVTATETANIGKPACRVASQLLKIRVNPRTSINLIDTSTVCAGTGFINIGLVPGSYQWTGPNGFSSADSMYQFYPVTPAHAGTYYLVLTNSFGCKWRDSSLLIVKPRPIATVLEDSFAFCEGDSVQLHASGGENYRWSPSFGLSSVTSASPIASPRDSTLYRVVVSNGICQDSTEVLVYVHENPKAYAGSDLVITEGEGIVLNAAIAGSPFSYSWSPNYRINDVNALKPFVSPLKDTFYVLNVLSLLGCAPDSDTVRVRVLKSIVAPNVFTPNGDGVNDLWIIKGLETYPDHDVKLFNAYGQMVFQSKNFSSWNGNYKGKPLPVGTYYYIIDVPERGRLAGYVDILR